MGWSPPTSAWNGANIPRAKRRQAEVDAAVREGLRQARSRTAAAHKHRGALVAEDEVMVLYEADVAGILAAWREQHR